MSVYIYSGKDLYRLESAIRDKLKKLGVDKDHIVRFDGSKKSDFEMERVLLECDTFSLFDSSAKKAVIVENPFFLNGSSAAKVVKKKKKEKDEGKSSLLEQYLKHPNPSTELFFYCHGYDADKRKKEYSMIVQYGGQVMNFQLMKESEFNAYAASVLKQKGIVLDVKGMQELCERCALDTLRLHQAVEKLAVYGDKTPDYETVCHVVPLNDEVSVFKLGNMFLDGNLDGVLKAYRMMLNNNEPVSLMITLLASSLRRMYNMKILYEAGLGEEEIAVRLHYKNKWAVHYGMRNGADLSARTLLRFLKELADLDQDIKAGNVDANDGFESFLIKNGKKNAGC